MELKAAVFAIKCFCRDAKKSVIKLLPDNTTVVTYLNNMGGTEEELNDIAREIWLWCHSNKNLIICAHLPGVLNEHGDKQSRCKQDNMEWELNQDIFLELCGRWGTPEIDVFANRLNHKLNDYFSWKPDSGAKAIDAMTENWVNYFAHIFSPFNMVGRVLRKLEAEQGTAILIVPKWPPQSW